MSNSRTMRETVNLAGDVTVNIPILMDRVKGGTAMREDIVNASGAILKLQGSNSQSEDDSWEVVTANLTDKIAVSLNPSDVKRYFRYRIVYSGGAADTTAKVHINRWF